MSNPFNPCVVNLADNRVGRVIGYCVEESREVLLTLLSLLLPMRRAQFRIIRVKYASPLSINEEMTRCLLTMSK